MALQVHNLESQIHNMGSQGGDTWDGGSSPFSPPFATILKAILHKCILAFSANKNEGEREIFQIQVKR